MSLRSSFALGKPVEGASKRVYIIKRLLSVKGSFGKTYVAALEQRSGVSASDAAREYVIKVPTVDESQLPLDKLQRLTETIGSLIAEYINAQRLREIDCVAHLVDYGLFAFQLSDEILAPSIFVVQEFIDGLPMEDFLERYCRPGMESRENCMCPRAAYEGLRDPAVPETRIQREASLSFRGVGNKDCFFDWARTLTANLKAIHRCQVVHGDIWPPNIMVTKEGRPVFIDFGQAILRDLAVGQNVNEPKTHAFTPPEKQRSVGGDIYSLGAVLFKLATGDPPPAPDPDIDGLKQTVAEAIKTKNPTLYKQNCGIADIIARCLRVSQHSRIPHAEGLLQDIKTFSGANGKDDPMPTSLADGLNSLSEQPLFQRMANLRLSLLVNDIQDMQRGVYDLRGHHENIVSGLTQYLSLLGAGDQYLTLSLPSFWYTENLGVNGRFLAMNRIVAQKGATLRRVFLFTEDDLAGTNPKRDEVLRIVQSHQLVLKELSEEGINIAERHLDAGGYYTGYVIVEARERQALVREGRHFGLMKMAHATLSGSGATIIVFPIYRDDGTIVQFQFRSKPELETDLHKRFDVYLSKSTPLSSFAP